MKYIKLSLIALIVTSLSSCLKGKNDFAGLREDEGNIVVSITEKQYVNTDLQNIYFGWSIFSNFSFATPNEDVKFFTLHIAQPRAKKLSGPLTVKVEMTPLAGYTEPPAGAVTIQDIVVPQSSATAFDYPVKFTVNKSLLDEGEHYGATFTITSVSEGVFSDLDKSLDVIFNEDAYYNTSKWTGVYKATTTIEDANHVYGVHENTRTFFLSEDAPDEIHTLDTYIYAFGSSTAFYLYANNLSTGANTRIVPVAYILDNNGKVVDVINQLTGVSLSPTFDSSAPNSFVYTSNDDRLLSVKYKATLTVDGVAREFTITDKYAYAGIQAFY